MAKRSYQASDKTGCPSIMPVTEDEWEAILGKEKLPSQR
ncbi:EVE domain-containing protein [Vibrio parahaemolyticus]|nr:EVE domain-containing protein [Vibrio parahaemolyticus]